MKQKPLVKFVLLPLVIGLFLGGSVLGTIAWNSHQAALEYAAEAQKHHPHPGDDVAALIDFFQTDSHPLKDRNRAVWALGRWSDPRAIQPLQAAYTGLPCDHDTQLCQYEIHKAILRCGGNAERPPESFHRASAR